MIVKGTASGGAFGIKKPTPEQEPVKYNDVN